MPDPEIVQCVACGGAYQPVQNDGSLYFHVCPPRRVVGSTPVPTKENPDAVEPVFEKIANRRNENVQRVDDDGAAVIKSHGMGVSPVNDPTVIAQFTNTEDEV